MAVADAANENLIGKKAAVFPLLPCFQCPACQIGEYAQCANYDYYGSRRDGGFAEYINVNKWNLVMMPDNVSYEEAAMCEPCAVAIHALSQVGIEFGDTVAISGAGTIGLLLAYIASSWGAGKVLLLDIDERKLDFARQLGFQYTINTSHEEFQEKISQITHGRGATVVVEGAGVGTSLENCLKISSDFGRVVVMGNPIGDVLLHRNTYWEILRKQLKLKGTWNSSYNSMRNDWEKVMTALENGQLNLKPLITHRYHFSECNKAFEMIRERKELAVKVMFVNE